MRPMTRNSPEAAGRLLALVLVADGHVSRVEIDGLRDLHAERRLGLAPGDLGRMLGQLCQDLLASAPEATGLAQALDEATINALLDEVDDPLLQRRVFELAMAATRADGHADEGELSLLGSMIVRWALFEANETPRLRPLSHAARVTADRPAG